MLNNGVKVKQIKTETLITVVELSKSVIVLPPLRRLLGLYSDYHASVVRASFVKMLCTS